MPSKVQLEKALRNADAAGDHEAAIQLATALKSGQYDQEDKQQSGGVIDSINSAIMNNPIGRTVAEVAAAVNRGASQLADFLTTDQVNNVAQLAGSDYRMPSITTALDAATAGNFMNPGLPKDIVRSAGETAPAALGGGSLFRGAAEQLPAIVSGSEKVVPTLIRAAGSSTPLADIGFGAISGAGKEVGEEVGGANGALIGSVGAPVLAASGGLLLKSAINAGKSGIDAIFGATKGMSEDGAAKMLAEAMVREGLSPDEVAKKVADMGENGIMADVGNNFARLLRVASNKIPRIEGQASKVLGERQAGQAGRIASSLDDATGTSMLNADDEIARLENTMGPRIKELYDKAKSTDFTPSPRLVGLMENSPTVKNAVADAKKNLADYEAAGIPATPMSLIDEVKKSLDAQIQAAIRSGDKGTIGKVSALKNIIVDEADKAAPVYAQARSLYAGKEELKNAADLGESFFKTSHRELADLTKSMGESEKQMYKLGAKQAITDRFDNINSNADLVARTFGKNGDIYKLKTLFDDQAGFDKFKNTLEQEANWTMTRRAAQANSTTVKQASDETSAQEALGLARDAISSPMGAANAVGKIIGGLGKGKGDKEFIEALEKAGDILLAKGMNPDAVRSLLKKGNAESVEKALRSTLGIDKSTSLGSLGSSQLGSTQEAKKQQKVAK